MPAYTITTNTNVNEELGLQYVVKLYNDAQAALVREGDPPYVPLTATQYLKQQVVNAVISDYKRQYKQKLRDAAAGAVQFD